MKGNINQIYTVEWVKGFATTDEDRAIERAEKIAFETGLPINIYLNGASHAYVKPTGLAIKLQEKTETVAAKYYDLKKYNNANFKRLSFR